MKTFATAAVLALAGIAPAARAGGCMDKVQTGSQMAGCAVADANAADAELNRVYRQVMEKHAKDRVFVDKLRTAQRAWIAFRDAEIAARYPATDPGSAYGNVYPMCAARFREELIRTRTAQLRRWLDGAQEGDVCSGSLPIHADTD